MASEITVLRSTMRADVLYEDVLKPMDRAWFEELLRKVAEQLERDFWQAIVDGYEVPKEVARVMPRCLCGQYAVLHDPNCEVWRTIS